MRALFLGAHPDDVEISAGGTIVKLVKEDCEVWISPQFKASPERTEEGLEAAMILGATYMPVSHPTRKDSIEFWSDMRFDLIVTPPNSDTHQEHRDVATLGWGLARRNDTKLWEMNHAIPGGVYGGPTLNHFETFDLATHRLKMAAVKAHVSQTEKYGWWWEEAIYTRDKYYGLMVQRQTPIYAEGFRIVIG